MNNEEFNEYISISKLIKNHQKIFKQLNNCNLDILLLELEDISNETLKLSTILLNNINILENSTENILNIVNILNIYVGNIQELIFDLYRFR
jgi:hypothetical protein